MSIVWHFKKYWKLYTVLTIAFLLRIILLQYALQYRENTDVLRYRDWAQIAFLHGFADTYTTSHISFGMLPNNQPPGSVYILFSSYYIQLQVVKILMHVVHFQTGQNTWINGQLIDIFLRLPSIIADLGIGIFIFLLTKKITNKNNALIASSLFLFNPVIFYNSSFWGQMDSLNNIFLLVACFLLYKKKFIFSVSFFFLSLLIKLSLLPVFPFFILGVYVFSKSLKKTLVSLLIGFFFFLLFTFPVSTNPILWIWNYVTKNGMGEMPNITAFAFNFWWVLYKPSIVFSNQSNLFTFSSIQLIHAPLSSSKVFGLSLSAYAIILFTFFCLPLLFFFNKKKISFIQIMLILAVVSMLIFIFLPQMHERYLYPFFVLCPVVLSLYKKMQWFYILLSILGWINLYLVWHPVAFFIFPYQIMINPWFQWNISFIILLLSISFYIYSLKILYEKK